MATKNKERTPTPVTLGNDPELDPGAAEPSSTDSNDVDSLLDSVLGSEDAEGESKPLAAAPPAANSDAPAGDPPPAKDPAADPATGKPPTGPRTEVEPPVEPAPAADPKPDPNAPPHDAEIDGIKQPDGLNPANQNNFKSLREVARKYKGLANQHYDEAEALKKQVGQIPPEIQKELEENRSFRRMFDITNDQTFKDQFDKPSGEAQEEIYTLLKKHGGTDEHIKMLKEKGISTIPDKWWEENVFKPLRESDSTDENTAGLVIKQRLEKIRSLAYERQREVEKASGSQSEFLQKRDAETKAKEAEELSTMQKVVEEIQAKVPWARMQEIPANATPEQKSQIESDNEFYKQTEERFKVALFPKTPEARVQTAIAACFSFRLHKELTDERATNEQLRAENAKLKGANIIKPSSTAVVNAPKPSTDNDRLKMKNEDGIEAGMREFGI